MTTGRARVDTQYLSTPLLVPTGRKGVTAVIGPTERGEIGKATLVASWSDFRKYFGGFLSTSDFPLICKTALDGGAVLLVSRAGHYTDITSAATLVGTKAVGTIGSAGNVVSFEATSVGAWANGQLTVTSAAAANGVVGEKDYTIALSGYPELTVVVKNLPDALNTAAQTKFNSAAPHLVKMTSFTGSPVAGTATFSTGAQTVGDIVAADYVGNAAASTGIHVFSNYSQVGFVRIAAPAIVDNTVDLALASYVNNSSGIRAYLRTPVGVSGDTGRAYRNCTGLYSGTAVNSWRTSMAFGTVVVADPLTGLDKSITALPCVLAAQSRRDNASYPWVAAAGSVFGRIGNVKEVEYNLGAPARATEFDQAVDAGLNAVIDDPQFGPVFWGNRTLWRSDDLVTRENIADLLLWYERVGLPEIRKVLFTPNDVQTWRQIYARNKALLDDVAANQGLYGGEGDGWVYAGDQFVDLVQQATINNPNNVQLGQYIYYLYLKPVGALEYIGVRVVVTALSVNFDLEAPPLSSI